MYIYHNMVINKHFLPQTDDFKNQQNILIKGLVQFFYYHQYDEDKYPTFRCCDLQTLEGDLIYTFYNITGGYNYIYDDPNSMFSEDLVGLFEGITEMMNGFDE